MELNTNNFNIEGSIKNLLSTIFKVKSELGSTILAEGKNPHFLIFDEESGEYINSYYELKLDKETSQGVGSALSYAKRQILQACFTLSAGREDPSDDDGHVASNPATETKAPVVGQVTSSTAFQIARVALKEINSIVGLDAWKEIQPEVVRSNRQVIELVKAKNAELKMTS